MKEEDLAQLGVATVGGHLALLKALADGEIIAERRRVELCSIRDFTPRSAFEALGPRRGFLRAREVYDFLYRQDSSDAASNASITMEDVEAALRPNATKLGELKYKGFMLMALPRADSRIHDAVIARGEIATRSVDEVSKSNGQLDFMINNHDVNELYAWPLTRDISSTISPKVAKSLERLLTQETLLAREIRQLRDAAGSTAADVFKLMLAEQSDDPEEDLEKSLTIRDVSRALEKKGVLTSFQVDALWRRLDAAREGLINLAEVGRILEDLTYNKIRPRIPTAEEEWMEREPPVRVAPSPCPFGLPLDPELKQRGEAYAIGLKKEHGRDLWAPWSDESQAAERQWAAFSAKTETGLTQAAGPKEYDKMCSPGVLVVLNTMAQQAKLYAQVESAKEALPRHASIETCFATLDRSKRGYIEDTDIWQILRENGFDLPLGNCCSLVREVKHIRPPDPHVKQNSLSLREFGEVVLSRVSKEYAALRLTHSDDEAWSLLYVLRHSQPCPECGARIQRSGDDGTCLSVKCFYCGLIFRCFKRAEDDDDTVAREEMLRFSGLDINGDDPEHQKAFVQLLRLLDVSAKAADKHEELRRNLISGSWESIPELLEATFKAISRHSGGRASGFAWEDLRDVMAMHGIHASDQELNCLWHRYAGGTKVLSTETPYGRFCDMLRPFDLSKNRLATQVQRFGDRVFKKSARQTIYSMPTTI